MNPADGHNAARMMIDDFGADCTAQDEDGVDAELSGAANLRAEKHLGPLAR